MVAILQNLGWLRLVLFLGLVGTGCGKQKTQMNENWNGGLITKQGIYKLVSSKQTISVWVDNEHLVRYSITDADGKLLLTSNERPSVYGKWFILFDNKGWLWFESSDIGCSVSRKHPDGTYQEFPIIDQVDLIREMPDEFFMRLPESTQMKWSVHRKQGRVELDMPIIAPAAPTKLRD